MRTVGFSTSDAVSAERRVHVETLETEVADGRTMEEGERTGRAAGAEHGGLDKVRGWQGWNTSPWRRILYFTHSHTSSSIERTRTQPATRPSPTKRKGPPGDVDGEDAAERPAGGDTPTSSVSFDRPDFGLQRRREKESREGPSDLLSLSSNSDRFLDRSSPRRTRRITRCR